MKKAGIVYQFSYSAVSPAVDHVIAVDRHGNIQRIEIVGVEGDPSFFMNSAHYHRWIADCIDKASEEAKVEFAMEGAIN